MVTRLRLLLLSLFVGLATVHAAAPVPSHREPYAGCLLAAANQREVLRARDYLHAAIPARVLLMQSPEGGMGHAALVFCLSPEGWMVYDDTFGSRPLRAHSRLIAGSLSGSFPDPLTAARAAFPAWRIGQAWYMQPAAR